MAIGQERTLEQDPALAFRIIVDIAAKGLSPAINDPTTAVLAIDQIHHAPHNVGGRHSDDERVRDAAGRVRLVLRTPAWGDFVQLAVTEIRQFGRENIQIVRRLRAMLENLIESLPAQRTAVLRAELDLLRRSAERFFTEPEERAMAEVGDSQGVGSKWEQNPNCRKTGRRSRHDNRPTDPSSGHGHAHRNDDRDWAGREFCRVDRRGPELAAGDEGRVGKLRVRAPGDGGLVTSVSAGRPDGLGWVSHSRGLPRRTLRTRLRQACQGECGRCVGDDGGASRVVGDCRAALLYLLLPLMSASESLQVDATKIVISLLVTQLAPLCLGLGVRHWSPGLANRLLRSANILQRDP